MFVAQTASLLCRGLPTRQSFEFSHVLSIASLTAKAQRILAEALGRLGWTEPGLTRRHKSDPAKLAIGAPQR